MKRRASPNSSALGMSSHSLLNLTSVRSGSRILKAWSWNVRALSAISSGESIGRSADRPLGIADPGRVVADDHHGHVPGGLELAQLLEHDHMAEVDVGRRRVDAELDPQRLASREPSLELAGRQHVHRPERQVGDRFGVLEAGFPHRRNARLTRRPGALAGAGGS